MSKKIRIMVVEDDPMLLELHVEFIKQHGFYDIVGVASNIADAKLMIQKLSPDLILLDNYLPDGKGIDLLLFLASNRINCYAIFITAANDMETCSFAIRHGVFDYLLKPVSYDRLKKTLNSFDLFWDRQHSSRQINQRTVDELFNLQVKENVSKSSAETKGIDDITLNRVLAYFDDNEGLLSVDSISDALDLSRTTTRRYLTYGVQNNLLTVTLKHGKVGRPERFYSKLHPFQQI